MDCILYKGIEILAYMMAYQPERESIGSQHALWKRQWRISAVVLMGNVFLACVFCVLFFIFRTFDIALLVISNFENQTRVLFQI